MAATAAVVTMMKAAMEPAAAKRLPLQAADNVWTVALVGRALVHFQRTDLARRAWVHTCTCRLRPDEALLTTCHQTCTPSASFCSKCGTISDRRWSVAHSWKHCALATSCHPLSCSGTVSSRRSSCGSRIPCPPIARQYTFCWISSGVCRACSLRPASRRPALCHGDSASRRQALCHGDCK